MKLKSEAFAEGGEIPVRFTCDAADVSPALAWTEPPGATASLALLVNDPDAPRGSWVHWVLYDLPPDTRELPEAVAGRKTLASGAHQGRNDFGKIGYGGPCPPHGPAHRYHFTLYALDEMTGLPAGATRADLQRAIKGHVLATAELMGRYQRG